MKYFKHILLALSLILFSAFTPLAYADDSQLFGACGTNSKTATSAICGDKGTTKNPVAHYIKVASSVVAVLTGVAAVIIIIIGGFTLVTSSGNSEAVATARKRIIYALTGMVIVALAWVIITFLTNRLIKT